MSEWAKIQIWDLTQEGGLLRVLETMRCRDTDEEIDKMLLNNLGVVRESLKAGLGLTKNGRLFKPKPRKDQRHGNSLTNRRSLTGRRAVVKRRFNIAA